MIVGDLYYRLLAERKAARRHQSLVDSAEALRGAVALELGGPSALFGRLGLCPVYPRLGSLDVLDYSEQTIWSAADPGGIEPRRRIIGEAGSIDAVADASYDAVLASHVLEHIANPLGALAEWQRVVRRGGYLLLVLPHRDGTFDHRRPVTSIEHMRADRLNEVGEDDLTHLEEVLALHDLERDPGAPGRAGFEQRCRENLSTRAMHHHVFDTESAFQMCRAADLEVLTLHPELPHDILCLCSAGGGQRPPLGEQDLNDVLARSPFDSDRRAVGRDRGTV